MKKGFDIEGTVMSTLRHLKEGGMSFTIHTPSTLPVESAIELAKLYQEELRVILIPNDTSEIEKVEDNSEISSPTKRLQKVLFRLYKTKEEMKLDVPNNFGKFFRKEIEAVIEDKLTKINELTNE